jgi:bifunctional non-homologous end joining protein LigD
MIPAEGTQLVDVDGRQVRIGHLDKVMYPAVGMTKAEVIDYYSRVAIALLPQLRDRPVTRIRFPQGVGGERFFEKNVPAGAPGWLRRLTISAVPGSPDEGPGEGKDLVYPFIDDLAALVWTANQSALELHTPQWRVGLEDEVLPPDRLVIDLDPGPPAALAECVRAARLVADRLHDDGLETVPVTSGSKGLQLYARLDGNQTALDVRQYVHDLAFELARAHPALIVAVMRKDLRGGKVLLDWSQNHPGKTTITPYSLRGGPLPTVAAPRSWAELADDEIEQLSPDEVLDRLEAEGDPFAGT